MLRRVHVADLRTGSVPLDPAEAHHVRDVLRLTAGSLLELFNDAGQTASGIIRHVNPANVVVDVESIADAPRKSGRRVTVAAAIPKGDRADWMIEKLTELGTDRFIPLATERSVVLPAGRNKIERWERIAVESAKQSRRIGVMAIAPLTELKDALQSPGWFCSTTSGATPIREALHKLPEDQITLLIGPEGGWTRQEIELMVSGGLIAVALTSTILRVETAAVTAAAIVLLSS